MRSILLSCVALLGLLLAMPAHAQVTSTYALSDCSVSSLTGSSQSLVASNPQRKYLLVFNSGANTAYVNLAGGTAAVSGASSVSLPSGASVVVTGAAVSRSAATVIGTASQPITCYEGR